MITSITVRDLEINKHQIDKYAIVFIYFENKNKFDDVVKAMISREIHLIKNLRMNLLIENNILEFEYINIFTFTNTAYIESCEIIISIAINVKFKSQHMSMHALKTITLSFNFECFVKIYNIILFDRSKLFFRIKFFDNFLYLCSCS